MVATATRSFNVRKERETAPASTADQPDEDRTHSSLAWRVREYGPPSVMITGLVDDGELKT